jgi:hypothetical protein
VAVDPLYGDRPKPPLVSLNNDEIVDFDAARSVARMSLRARGLTLVGVIAGAARVQTWCKQTRRRRLARDIIRVPFHP